MLDVDAIFSVAAVGGVAEHFVGWQVGAFVFVGIDGAHVGAAATLEAGGVAAATHAEGPPTGGGGLGDCGLCVDCFGGSGIVGCMGKGFDVLV